MKRNAFLLLLVLLLLVNMGACSTGIVQQTSPSNIITSLPADTPSAAATTTTEPTAEPIPTVPLSYANPQRYDILYTMTISNTGFSPSDVRLYLPLPVEWDAQKELNIVEITPEPDSQTTAEPSGNAMLYWQLKQTPKKNTTKEIILDFTLTAYETNTQIDPASVQLYRQGSEEVLRYTKSEVYIESDDPEIISLADTLAGKETNPYMIAKIFYDHIIDTAEYQLLGQGLNGAKYLLENGEGECGDYSALFVALCRAKGIPARPVVGYWAVSGNEQTHVWAEFFLESIGWIPVDATIGQQSDENRSYYFGNMDNQRVILSKGYNTPLVPEGPDGFIAPILQVPLWWFWGSGNADGFSLQRDWHVDKIQ